MGWIPCQILSDLGLGVLLAFVFFNIVFGLFCRNFSQLWPETFKKRDTLNFPLDQNIIENQMSNTKANPWNALLMCLCMGRGGV